MYITWCSEDKKLYCVSYLCLLSQSADSRLWRHVLNCSVVKNSRLCSVELSTCLQNLWPQYGNSSSYWNVFPWNTKQWKMSTNWIIDKFHQNSFNNLYLYNFWKGNITYIMPVPLEYYLHHACPLGINHLPLEVFSWFFGEICWESSGFIIDIQENRVRCVKTNLHFQSYLTQLLLECFSQKF